MWVAQVLRTARDQGCAGVLRAIENPEDSVSLERIINVPRRGIGDSTLAARALAQEKGLPLLKA